MYKFVENDRCAYRTSGTSAPNQKIGKSVSKVCRYQFEEKFMDIIARKMLCKRCITVLLKNHDKNCNDDNHNSKELNVIIVSFIR